MNKNIFRPVCMMILAALLSFIFPVNLAHVTAASFNGALSVPYKFRNLEGDDKPNAFNNTNLINIAMKTGRSKKKVNLSGLKASTTIYIPRKTVSSNGSSFGVVISAVTNPNKYGSKQNACSLDGAYIAAIYKQKGKIKKGLYDAMDGSELNGAGKHIKIKRGKGDYKDYYLMTVKNIPYTFLDGHSISNSKHFLYAAVLSVYGQKQKASGRIYVDNFNIKRGKMNVINYTFDNKKGLPKECSIVSGDKTVKDAGIAGL